MLASYAPIRYLVGVIAIIVALVVAARLSTPAPPIARADRLTPDAHVELTGTQLGSMVSIELGNQTGRARWFDPALVIEHLDATGWHRLEQTDLTLRPCSFSAEPAFEPWGLARRCVQVAAFSTYQAPPWSGMIGDAQCMCEQCAPAAAGTYRYVARYCDRDDNVVGAPFELRPRDHRIAK